MYESPDAFDGFRFHRMRSEPGANPHTHQFVNTGLESMTFGHGRFACPGKFFASNESKIILAILLLKYDIKSEGEGRPENQYFADACFPNPDLKVLFRKRVA